MYRNKNVCDESDDENSIDNFNSSDLDSEDNLNQNNILEDDLFNKLENLDLSNEKKSTNKRNKRVFNDRKSFDKSELDIKVWEQIKWHTKEKIMSYMNFFNNFDKYDGPFEKGADTQTGKGRIKEEMKYDTSNADGLKYCVDPEIRLDDCTHIDASHVIGIKSKPTFNDILHKEVSKTNPLPKCFNNGPDKRLENFLLGLVNTTKNMEDFEKMKDNFLKKLNTVHYPNEIKKLYKNEIRKMSYSKKKMHYNN